MNDVSFHRDPDPAPGVRQYTVTDPAHHTGAQVLGVVTNRPGGWWRAITRDGRIVKSWCSTRKEAAAALLTSGVRG